MKLKVLFILPVLIFSALWWAPLAIALVPAGTPSPDTPSFSDSVNHEKTDQEILQNDLIALEKEKSVLDNQLKETGSTLNLKESEMKLAESQKNASCGYNSSGDVCAGLTKKYTDSVTAYTDAFNINKAKQAEVDAKQKEIDAKNAQLADPQSTANPSSAPTDVNPNSGKGGTILPDTAYQSISDCEIIMRYVNIHSKEIEKAIIDRKSEILGADGEYIISSATDNYNPSYTDILGCAIKTGDVKLWMVPYFARYILEFIIGIAGLASVAGIIYGGYFYLFAGLSDDQQKGKNAIKNSLIALVLSLSAWAIVNIVISLVTSI